MAQQRASVSQTFISLIIPTLNEEGYVGALLNDLFHQTKQPDQVIISDGKSVDTTKQIVEKWRKKWPAVQFFVCSTRGVGFQRDLGGKRAIAVKKLARGKNSVQNINGNLAIQSNTHLLYFLDADVRLPKYFLARTSHHIKQQKLDAACPHYLPRTQSLPVKVIFSFFNCIFRLGQKHYPSGAGPCMIATADHFKKIGGFNTGILVDDLDFVHRAGKLGRFQILPQSVLVSTRRFEQYGTWQTFWQYLQISWHFVRKATHRTNEISYEFGKFTK